ncbi:alpha- and gamma-adaptin-binding protein p34 [Biomphalaria pfeifferi]|uniref:Alpha- and gamma-adaptin-binding protein p34 n=1 Tax=Biomphalaria pfeifferi TaxID=112525 RepID=A0AAD8CCU1_BIOPF|nr:alpha- and gamma-adaptin-binding protein p34 [Biomphalaria pfeifferi]
MALPIALFSSSSEHYKPLEFVKSILKPSDLPTPKVVCDEIESYEWHFETKYYDTTIQLCTTENRTIGNEDFASSVEAFVHYFDPNSITSFDGVKAWLPYLKHIEPEVQMLVCTTNKNTDVVCKRVVQEWCIQHGFELVELEPEAETDAEEDDFPETTGMARIIQALHAHTWSNLNMKNSPTVYSPYMQQLMKDQQILNHSTDGQTPLAPVPSYHQQTCCTDTSQTCSTGNKPDSVLETCLTNEVLPSGVQEEASSVNEGHTLEDIDWMTLLKSDEDASDTLMGDELGIEEFEKLFMKLKVMKDKAEVLLPEERKKYAEKVAISFWKAVGGDEAEIEGLEDDSD